MKPGIINSILIAACTAAAIAFVYKPHTMQKDYSCIDRARLSQHIGPSARINYLAPGKQPTLGFIRYMLAPAVINTGFRPGDSTLFIAERPFTNDSLPDSLKKANVTWSYEDSFYHYILLAPASP